MSRLIDMMGQIKKLKNGVGIQSLLDSAYEIMGNPMLIFDTEYKLLAYNNVAVDDPIWNEMVTHGTFSLDTQRFFDKEGFIEDIANAARTAFLTSDQLKYNRISGKIFNKNNSYVANIVILESNKPFEKSDPMVFEAICKLISKEISSIEFYQEYEQTHQEAIIKSLIDGTYDIKLDMAQVGGIYDSLKSSLYIAVVDISQCDAEYSCIVKFRDMFKQTNPAYKYAIYLNYIIIIISTNDDVLNVSKELGDLIQLFEQHNMYAGISPRFENLFELQKYYQKAMNAMQYALEAKSSQHIFPCNENSMEKMAQIEKLKNGEGIQYFLNIGPKIFGNPLLFHDMELNLLAYSENVEICDPIWQELITYGTSSCETIELFRTEGFIDIMDNTRGGAILISDKIKYDRISWRIYSNDNIRIGCTSIVNTIKPFSEDELVLFGAFSQKFSREVGKIEFYNNYGRLYSETIINRLISGTIEDHNFYSDDVGNLYDNFMDHLYLMVVNTARCSREHVSLTYFRELFNWPGTMNRYAIYDDSIIIIISIDDAPLHEKKEFGEISKTFDQDNIYAGISSCFGNIYELQKYYQEAARALADGLQNSGPHNQPRIFLYDDTYSVHS